MSKYNHVIRTANSDLYFCTVGRQASAVPLFVNRFTDGVSLMGRQPVRRVLRESRKEWWWR